MHTGGFERHISRSRKVYQARRDALMAALDRELADLPHEVSRSEAGLHLLLHMRNGMLEHELIERAKRSVCVFTRFRRTIRRRSSRREQRLCSAMPV